MCVEMEENKRAHSVGLLPTRGLLPSDDDHDFKQLP